MIAPVTHHQDVPNSIPHEQDSRSFPLPRLSRPRQHVTLVPASSQFKMILDDTSGSLQRWDTHHHSKIYHMVPGARRMIKLTCLCIIN